MKEMQRFKERSRFNARILDDRPPPGASGAFPSLGVEVALSREAGALLEAAQISFREGAGGVIARIKPGDLDDLPEDLGTAVTEAYRGWVGPNYQWRVKDSKTVDLSGRPKIMGILNVTPDSFSDGGLFTSKEDAVRRGLAMIEAGAEIVDVGGESTRPGSEAVAARTEIDRTVPVIQELKERSGALISIDTTKAEVAEAALNAGASIVNDISGLTFDKDMAPLAASTGAGLVIMHIRGRPKDMQENPLYEDTLAEVCLELRERLLLALEAGVEPDRIVLDPGIGFGKRFEDNLRLLARIGELRSIGFPLLFGCSRKSFLGSITGRQAPERILETVASSVTAAWGGVHVLRVHDVPENLIGLKVAEAVLREMRRGP